MTAAIRAEQIARDFAYAEAHFRAIEPIPHHAWTVAPGELYWFAGDALRSVAHGASIFLGRLPADPIIEDQLHIEVRLFWNEPEHISTSGTHRAILWCERGPRFFGRSTSLIGDRASFFYAHSIENLCEDLSEAIGIGLYAWRRHREAI